MKNLNITNRNLIWVLAICAGMVFSCTAEGLTGPEGPTGPTGAAGANGAPGAIGASGKDGSTMYSGNGAPAIALGNNGDYYLDKSTGNLYGPKLAAGWGTPFLLMGAPGLNGTNGTDGAQGLAGTNGTNGTNGLNGNKTLSGLVAPAAADGNPGDFYLDKTAYLLYGPKNVDGWGIPILLRGADGAQGPVGPAGKDGSIIYSGDYNPADNLGKSGDYYFGKYTGLWGPKTANGWGTPVDLKGPAGEKGADGADGSITLSGNGIPAPGLGVLGDFYLDKTNYLLYGPKTADGWGLALLLRGANGAQGPAGPAGEDGTVIYSGETEPDEALGKLGDFYFARVTAIMYGPKGNLGWGPGTNLKGANGTNGMNGTNGANGNSILNGTGLPLNTLGNNGDFYIDISTYVMYGPKTAGTWSPYGTSLKGQNGADGNANVVALETADNISFSWSYEFNNRILKKQGLSFNDTSTVFNIPAANFNAVKNGVVLVYLRASEGGGSFSWKQLNYTDISLGENIFYKYLLRVNTADARLRIMHNNRPDYTPLVVDKVRIVITPAGSTGILSRLREDEGSLVKTMQNLNLKDKDFVELK